MDQLFADEAGRCKRCGASREVRWVPAAVATTARLECPTCHTAVAI